MAIFQHGDADLTPARTSHRSPFSTIWRRPRETIRWIIAEDESLHVRWLVCLAGIAEWLIRDFARDTGTRSTVAIGSAILGAFVVGPLWGIVNVWFFSHAIRFTGRWIGGTAVREHLRAAIAWGLVPIVVGLPVWIVQVVNSNMFADEAPQPAIALLLVGLAGLILGVWSIVLLCQTVAEVQGFQSGWRAFGNLAMAATMWMALFVAIIVLGTGFL